MNTDYLKQRVEALEANNKKLSGELEFYKARIEILEQEIKQILFI
jgi:hypothetical protein